MRVYPQCFEGFGNVSEENLEEWLQNDAYDHDYQCMMQISSALSRAK
jgi:hypothetical protein